VVPALDLSLDDWDTTMAVNLRAPFVMARALAPAMIEQRWGKIINVSSQTGVIALDDHAAYASSKGGLNALTKSLCAEWARHNVQVNAICPTVVMTPMGIKVWSAEEKSGPMLAKTPLRRFGEPVEVADLALYLASPASGLVNGAIIMADGGFTAV
jgi:NAD(P)-dependent dehydrogenase (short-subunit alcohol dehydrogenase family)